jgi:hypothetical protein
MVLARHKSGYGPLTFRNCTRRSAGLILGPAITSSFGSRRAPDPRLPGESCTVSEDDTSQIRDRPANSVQFRKRNQFLGI